MSAIPCPVCGQLRKVEQVWTEAGWINPPCYRCGDPGWVQPDTDDSDPLDGRPDRPGDPPRAAPLDRT